MLLLHRFPRLTIALTLPVAVVYCSGGEDIVVPPPPGTLQIQTSTDGAEPDADGYSVQIDGGSSQGDRRRGDTLDPGGPPGQSHCGAGGHRRQLHHLKPQSSGDQGHSGRDGHSQLRRNVRRNDGRPQHNCGYQRAVS